DEDAVLQELGFREPLAARFAGDEAGEDVLLGIARPFPPVGHEPREVGEELGDGAVPGLEPLRRRDRAERAEDRERPGPQRPAISRRTRLCSGGSLETRLVVWCS